MSLCIETVSFIKHFILKEGRDGENSRTLTTIKVAAETAISSQGEYVYYMITTSCCEYVNILIGMIGRYQAHQTWSTLSAPRMDL